MLKLLKNKKFILICLVAIVLGGCGKEESNKVEAPEPKVVEESEFSEKFSGYNHNYGMWLTYWGNKDMDEKLAEHQDELDSLSMFAAYFDEDYRLFVPNEIKNIRNNQLSNPKFKDLKTYLTVVNDQECAEGNKSKDTELLYKAFETEETMYRLVDDIVVLAREGQYSGVEIDFEAINDDTMLWWYFIKFEKRLIEKTAENNLELRIILEPGIDIEKIEFPEGPEYVVMAYNLYGKTTGPGPKANKEFLEQLTKKMNILPGEVTYALANGGYDFCQDGTVTAISTEDAIDKLEKSLDDGFITDYIRDEASQAIYFLYMDDQDSFHEVWFADEQTIDFWMDTLEENNASKFMVWYLE